MFKLFFITLIFPLTNAYCEVKETQVYPTGNGTFRFIEYERPDGSPVNTLDDALKEIIDNLKFATSPIKDISFYKEIKISSFADEIALSTTVIDNVQIANGELFGIHSWYFLALINDKQFILEKIKETIEKKLVYERLNLISPLLLDVSVEEIQRRIELLFNQYNKIP